MDQNPGLQAIKAQFPSLVLNSTEIVGWDYIGITYMSSTAIREFVILRGCLKLNTYKYHLLPRPYMDLMFCHEYIQSPISPLFIK